MDDRKEWWERVRGICLHDNIAVLFFFLNKYSTIKVYIVEIILLTDLFH